MSTTIDESRDQLTPFWTARVRAGWHTEPVAPAPTLRHGFSHGRRSVPTWRIGVLIGALLLSGCAAGGDGERDAQSPPAPQSVDSDALFARRLDPDKPGCSAAVGVDGTVAWAGARGVADLVTGKGLHTGTIFDIASVSKQFTATAVLLLADGGGLSIGDPVSDHLPGLPTWAEQVTIAHLMHHTSGLPDYTEILEAQGYLPSQRTTQAEAVQAIARSPALRTRPGSRYEYTDSNYLLLAEIVRSVSGMPLPRFLQERIFEPLGLRMTMDPTVDIPGKAIRYTDALDGRGPQAADRWWEQIGGTGIQSTPSDLVRWADNYRTGKIGGRRLLDAQLADPVESNLPGTTYGAGIAVKPDGALFHDGGLPGLRTYFGITTDRHTAVAVACNFDDANPAALADELRKIWA
jgi:CubicO group peptidase (beta-lactamase class C family)